MWGSAGRAQRAEEERREQFRALFADPAPPPQPRWVRDGVDVTRRAVWRGRRILAPLVVLAVVAGSGGVVATRNVPVPAAVFLAAGTAGAWWWFRADRLDRAVERRYALTCLASAVAWLGWAAATGPSWTVLVIGWTVLSTPWVRHHWPRPRLDAPQVEPVGDGIPQRWEAGVSAQNRRLPGATLFDSGVFEHGNEWSVQLVPGAQTIDSALGVLDHVSSGLKTPMQRLVLEAHPDYLDDDPTIARLRVILTSPVKETLYFDCPRFRHGIAEMGPFIDGAGEATWRVYTEDSMWGGFVLGSSGIGKSRMIESLALTVRAMSAAGMPTMLVYLDGQDGASSSTLAEYASLSGGPDDATAILEALERVIVARQKWNKVHRLDGFTPGRSPDGTGEGLVGILVIIDEAHVVFDSRLGNAKRWARIAREGRKVGVVILAASQYNDLEVFGNEDPLRSSLLAGNGLAMHTASESASGLIPGLRINPSRLPAIPGFGYKIAAPQSGERTAPFRGRYLPNARAKAADPRITVPTVGEWFERTTDAPLDAMSARAMGEVYLCRHERAAAARERVLAELEGRVPATAAAPVSTVKRTTEDVIMDCLAQGSRTRAQIAAYVLENFGTGPDAVKHALQRLLTDGRVQRTGHGVYERTDAAGVAA